MDEIIIGILVGIVWGYVLYKAMVCDHGCIIGGLTMRNMTMLLVIMTSVTTTAIIIYPLSLMGIVKLIPKPTYVIGNLLGGAILGIGMAIAGYCPGTAIASMGAGKKDAMVTIAGGLVGAVLYAVLYPMLKPLLIDPYSFGKITLPGVLETQFGIPVIATVMIVLSMFILAIRYMAGKQYSTVQPVHKESRGAKVQPSRI